MTADRQHQAPAASSPSATSQHAASHAGNASKMNHTVVAMSDADLDRIREAQAKICAPTDRI